MQSEKPKEGISFAKINPTPVGGGVLNDDRTSEHKPLAQSSYASGALPEKSNRMANALMVSSVFSEADFRNHQENLHNRVYLALVPLLQRWGRITEVTRPESRLDYFLWRARQEGMEPLHISFLPFHSIYLTSRACNVAFTLWGLPDIPADDAANNPRNNWRRIADRLALLLTPSSFARSAFIRAGVKTPIHLVPVPIRSEYFAMPAWERTQQTLLDFAAYVFPQQTRNDSGPLSPIQIDRVSVQAHVKHFYGRHIKRHLPGSIAQILTTATARREAEGEDPVLPLPSALKLSGVVFTGMVNPFNPAEAWEDMLSAYLLALRDSEDATLVVKLVVRADQAPEGLTRIVRYYERLGIGHYCKLAIIADHLSDHQRIELTRASAYYINPLRAESACLPLQEFLAAGRPALSPKHTAMADYFDEAVGYVMASNPEPAPWPHDPEQRLVSTWHRLVWQSLHDQIQASYRLAKENAEGYRSLSSNARDRMSSYASVERVWPMLTAALDSVAKRRR